MAYLHRTALIHYRTAVLEKVVPSFQMGPRHYRFCVYHDDYMCGIGIAQHCGGGLFAVYGDRRRCDPIGVWRAIQLLRELGTVTDDAIAGAYWLGCRSADYSDDGVQHTIARLGGERYERIMNKPVPEFMVRAVLDFQDVSTQPNLRSITSEVRAGTLMWRDEFHERGVVNPAASDRRCEQYRNVANVFEPLLDAYFTAFALKPDSRVAQEIVRQLASLVDDGFDEGVHDVTLVALAGIYAFTGTGQDFTAALQNAAYWAFHQQPRHRIFPWRRTGFAASIREAREILWEMYRVTSDHAPATA